MDRKLDEVNVQFIVSIFIENDWEVTFENDYIKTTLASKQKLEEYFRKLTVKEIFDIINESDYDEDERNSRVLSQISIILMKNDIDNLSKETREIKEDVKNLNDKLTVLIDALSIIDQKITKS